MPESLNKVPEVTLAFWIIKIAATTLGETGGDTVTMTLNWGYLAGTALFLAALVVLISLQVTAKKFHPYLYWATIIASTTFGTTMADFADRSLGIGYPGGSSLLLSVVNPNVAILLSGLGIVITANVSTGQQVVGVLGLLGATLIDFVVPVAAFVVSGRAGRAFLRRVTLWLIRHNQALGTAVLVALGLLFAVRGIS